MRKRINFVFILILFILTGILAVLIYFSFQYLAPSKDPNVLTKQAWKLYDLKLYKQSINKLDAALKMRQNNKEIYVALGYNYFALKNYKKSIFDFLKANSISAEAQNYLMMGHSYTNMKQNVSAIKSYEKAFKMDPKKYEALKNIAQIYFAQNKYSKTIEYFTKANSISAEADNYIMMGHSYTNMKQNVSAIKSYEKAFKMDPKKYEALKNIAQIYFSQKDYGRAIEYFGKANLISAEAQNYLMMGHSYSKTGKDEDAAISYEKALKYPVGIKAKHETYHLLYFIYRDELRNYKKAERVINKARKLGANKVYDNYLLGILYKDFIYHKNNYKRDFSEFTQYILITKASEEIKTNIDMAEAYLFIQDKDNYLKWIRKAENINRASPAITRSLLNYYTRYYKDNDKALSCLDRLLSSASTEESYSLLKQKATIYIKQIRLTSARRLLNRLMIKHSEDPELISLLGLLYLESGKYARLNSMLPKIKLKDQASYYDIMYKLALRNKDYMSALKYYVKVIPYNNYN